MTENKTARKSKKILIGIALLAGAFVLLTIISHLQGQKNPVSGDSFYFDTTCRISIYDPKMPKEDAEHNIQLAFELCRSYESRLSKTREGSDIWKINHAGGEEVECDETTLECIEQGLKYSEMSDGAFDITIGRVMDLWDYHSEDPKLPDDESLKEAVATLGYGNVKVDKARSTVSVPDGTEIDLGGIAKGYIADRVCRMLKDKGVQSAIVNFGGNVECIGNKDGTDFEVGIEKPYSGQNEILTSTPLDDQTITTSGVYERFFEYEGKKYHHVLDTKTGMPVDTDLLSVSVEGPRGTSADCDALATICLIYGSEKGKELIESMEGFEALFVMKDETVEPTTGFVIK